MDLIDEQLAEDMMALIQEAGQIHEEDIINKLILKGHDPEKASTFVKMAGLAMSDED
jgi:hypothetical protein